MGLKVSTNPAAFPEIDGLKIERELAGGRYGTVYIGQHDAETVAVKVLKRQVMERDPGALKRFKREAGILARIQHPGFVRVLSVGDTGDGLPFLAMEYVEGETLGDYLKREGQIPEYRLIEMALELSDVLAEIHDQGILHRDIKPSNILVGKDGRIKLIDFGLAAEIQLELTPGGLSGTPNYASPEQAGAIDRPLDATSDLYSLGVVMFECSVGRLPFEAKSIYELVHLHTHARPPNPKTHAPKLSEGFSAIVEKLLAKDPEDRYHSATALAAALRMLRVQEGLGGEKDLGSFKVEETSWVGRALELKELENDWENVKNGRGRVSLIVGDSGSGKSRLAREAVRRIGGSALLVFHGKAAMDGGFPLSALNRTFESLRTQLDGLQEQKRTQLLQKIRKSAEGSEPFLKRLSPSFGEFFEDAEIARDASEDVYYQTIADFLVELSKQGPICLLFDDIVWIDAGTLNVLSRLSLRLLDCPIWILCTARGAERYQEARDRFVNAIDGQVLKVHQLGPIADTELRQLICAYLGSNLLDVELVRQLTTRSQGNPFAAIQTIKAMLDAGVLYPNWGTWAIKFEAMTELELPADVLQLIVKRVEGLSPAAREVLPVAALMGSPFKASVLSEIFKGTKGKVNLALSEGTGAGLIESDHPDSFVFVHDRIHEALLTFLDADTIRRRHQEIADVLDQIPEKDDELVFALANHRMSGLVEKAPERAVSAGFQAAARAYQGLQFEASWNYSRTAEELSKKYSVVRSALEEELIGDICHRTNRLKDVLDHYEAAKAQASNYLDRARLDGKIAWICTLLGRHNRAWEHIGFAFKTLGEKTPKPGVIGLIGSVGWLGLALLRSKLVSEPRHPSDEARLKLLIEISTNAIVLSYFDNKIIMITLLSARCFEWASRLGPSKELAYAYCSHAVNLSIMVNLRGTIEHYTDKGLKILEDLRDPLAIAHGRIYRAYCFWFLGDEVGLERVGRGLVDSEYKWADPQDYVDFCKVLVLALAYRGYASEVEPIARIVMGRSDALRLRIFMMVNAEASLILLGDFKRLEEYQQVIEGFIKDTPELDLFVVLGHLSAKTLLCLERDDLGATADRIIEEYRSYKVCSPLTPLGSVYFYISYPYIRLRQWISAPEAAKPDKLRLLKQSLREARFVRNKGLFRGHRLVVEAQLAMRTGRYTKMRKLLQEIGEIADATDSPWLVYETHLCKAQALREMGNQRASKEQALIAHQVAARHGWTQRQCKIEEEFSLDEFDLAYLGHSGSMSGSVGNSLAVSGTGSLVGSYAGSLTGSLVGSTANSMLASSPTSGASRSQNAGNGSTWSTFRAARFKRQSEALLAISRSSAGVRDYKMLAQQVLKEVCSALGAERGILFLENTQTSRLVPVVARDWQDKDLPNVSDYSQRTVDSVAITRKPIVIKNPHEAIGIGAESIILQNLRSIIAVPLLISDRLTGVLYLDNRLVRGAFTDEDVGVLTSLGAFIASALESAKLAQVEYEKRSLEKDLELTAAVQSLLLPQRNEFNLGWLECAAYYRSADQSGGDWWQYQVLDDGSIRVFVGDISGHGAGSAMVSAALAGAYQACPTTMAISDLLSTLNRALLSVGRGEYWAAFSAFELSAQSRTIRWWNAGMPGFIAMAEPGKPRAVSGVPTPMLGRAEFKPVSQEFEFPQDCEFLLFSDGVVELKARDGTVIGMRRLAKMAADIAIKGEAPIANRKAMVDRLQTQLNVASNSDDMTMLWLRRRAIASPSLWRGNETAGTPL